ncbi:D-amino-acid oxidase [Sporothrix schenckii 1099-18]|uniref:D-amino-acid oxidase n=1 Tax=Sporothrix schenckii 1099-18 TaxID=1397361 RepID=A0A0F2M3S2_SPOSC|nr:D-amino-acid oxidase [Sporothrix schenckii 1099-18]KJR84353.1 D-amino-acid oxidase [Sporothrix schenckii 1099-18]
MPNIVVIGAGVAGLTTALLLARDPKNRVTVVARHMPGDYDIEYTSPWAGADFLPMSPAPGSRWERETWPELRRLAADVPEAGIHFQKSLILRRDKKATAASVAPAADGDTASKLSDASSNDDPWFSTLVDDYRDVPTDQVPPGFVSASEFTSVCINTALYLPWLVGQCRAIGVVLRRAVLQHVTEAASFANLAVQTDGTTAAPSAGAVLDHSDTIVVNCSGLLACRLGGVMDKAVQPARGQVVVVRDELSPMLSAGKADDRYGAPPHSETVYNMMRAAGGGTVIGGTYQVGNWESQPDPNTALRLLARMAATHPTLVAAGKTAADLDVIRHGVGLRPYREGGVRLESEQIDLVEGLGTGKVWVVHNYGHAGWGYQGSYGCSQRVVELVAEIIAGKPGTA